LGAEALRSEAPLLERDHDLAVVAGLVDAVCARQAARPALFHGGRIVSYGELAALVEA